MRSSLVPAFRPGPVERAAQAVRRMRRDRDAVGRWPATDAELTAAMWRPAGVRIWREGKASERIRARTRAAELRAERPALSLPWREVLQDETCDECHSSLVRVDAKQGEAGTVKVCSLCRARDPAG